MVWPGAWPSHTLAESRRRLAELRDEVRELDGVSSETEAAMCRFLVVRSCGHIEFTFDEAFSSYAESQASPAIGAFVRAQFFRGRNPSADRIRDALLQLGAVYAERFTAFIDNEDQAIRRELGLLVDRRNKIAHGQSEGIGRSKAISLAEIALKVGDWITTELDPR